MLLSPYLRLFSLFLRDFKVSSAVLLILVVGLFVLLLLMLMSMMVLALCLRVV
jgi:hypothetical protein